MEAHAPRSQDEIIGEIRPEPAAPAILPPQRQNRGPLRALSSLRQRNYRLYWSSQLVSLIGTYMQTIGQAWLVLELTHSAWQLGLVGALQAMPILLFSIFGGVFADRWPKRQVILVVEVASMIQALALWALLATGAMRLWQLYLLAVLLGLTNSLGRPAMRAFVVELVGRTDLPNATALNFSSASLARIVGPSLAGLIIGASGKSALFLLNALSFLPVLVSLALINSHELHAQARPPAGARPEQPQTTWQSLREGLGYTWSTPAVVLMIVVVGLVLLFGSNFNVVLPLFATGVLHQGATGYGFLSAAAGAGALVAALRLALAKQKPAISSVLTGMLIFGVLEGAFAVSRFYPLSLGLIAGVSFMETAFATQSLTILQTVPPDDLRGRVMSVQVLFFDGSLPLGYLLMGWLASLYGAPVAMLIGAILSLTVVGAGWLRRRAAERDLAVSAHR